MLRSRLCSTVTLAVGAAALVASLAGCSGGGSGVTERALHDGSAKATAATPPKGTSAMATAKAGEGLPEGLRITVGRNDTFVAPEDLAAGARGIVVGATNDSDTAVMLYSKPALGPSAATSSSDDSTPNGELDSSRLPHGCDKIPNLMLSNQVMFNGAPADDEDLNIAVQPHSTVYGCGLLGQGALASGQKDLELKLGIPVDGGQDQNWVRADVSTDAF